MIRLWLAGARIKAEAHPNYSLRWRLSTTERVEVSADTIVTMADALHAIVGQGIEAEAGGSEAIDARTITTSAGMENV